MKLKFEELKIDWRPIFIDIEDIVVKTFLSIEQTLFAAQESNLGFKNNCFELFGFDILIDSSLKPWLLEVNLAPSLECSSELDF